MNKFSIIYNAKIYTMDKDQPNASALVIDTVNGHILAVGRKDQLLAEF